MVEGKKKLGPTEDLSHIKPRARYSRISKRGEIGLVISIPHTEKGQPDVSVFEPGCKPYLSEFRNRVSPKVNRQKN